jgi:hypothetical protein
LFENKCNFVLQVIEQNVQLAEVHNESVNNAGEIKQDEKIVRAECFLDFYNTNFAQPSTLSTESLESVTQPLMKQLPQEVDTCTSEPSRECGDSAIYGSTIPTADIDEYVACQAVMEDVINETVDSLEGEMGEHDESSIDVAVVVSNEENTVEESVEPEIPGRRRMPARAAKTDRSAAIVGGGGSDSENVPPLKSRAATRNGMRLCFLGFFGNQIILKWNVMNIISLKMFCYYVALFFIRKLLKILMCHKFSGSACMFVCSMLCLR